MFGYIGDDIVHHLDVSLEILEVLESVFLRQYGLLVALEIVGAGAESEHHGENDTKDIYKCFLHFLCV